MPTYVYHCDDCDTEFEARQRFSDAPLTACPEGHEGVRRVIRPAGIIFKGSGWYIKDSKNGSTPSTKKATPADTTTSDGGAEAKSDGGGDAKPESKSETSGDATPSPKKRDDGAAPSGEAA